MPYSFKIKPGAKVDLKDYDPNHDAGLDKDEGKERFAQLETEIETLQEQLYAAAQHSILIVLQGLDTSGKDGTIRKVFQSVNPQGCRIESFKVPTEEELAHDFLWRVHRVTPRKGMIAVFNRSHYEDVLVVRVHQIVPEKIWRARYDQINAFEHILAANDTIILKFFLHISKDEQEERLLAREQDIEKAWKLSVGDWKERAYWDDYQRAYAEMLGACSTDDAPWYVIPANKKWYRDLAVAEALVERLQGCRDAWADTLKAMSKARLDELAAYRQENR